MALLEQLTGLDILMLAIIAVSILVHAWRGFVRSILAIAGVILGLIIAAFFYHRLTPYYAGLTRTEAIADLTSFMTVFASVILAKETTTYLVYKFIKAARLTWLDRSLGVMFGLIKGWLINVVIVLALTAFPVKIELVHRSVLAPYMLLGAQAAVTIVPRDLKERFHKGYQKLRLIWKEDEIKHVRLDEK